MNARVLSLQAGAGAHARWHGGDTARADGYEFLIDFYDDLFGNDAHARQSLDEPIRLDLDVAAPGYEPAAMSLQLARGEETDVTVRLRRSGHAPPRPLAIEVLLPSGAGFEGILMLEVRSGEPGSARAAAQQTLRFRGGRAQEPVEVVPGTYRFRLVPSRTHDACFAAWEQPTAWIRHAVLPDGTDAALRFTLHGNPVRLDVRDADGARVVGYDLVVQRPGQLDMENRFAWDAQRACLVRMSGLADAPIVWLPSGRRTLGASLPGAGTATASFEADGSGREIELLLALPGRIGDPAPEGGPR